jgi:hypothetical protein
MYFKIWAEGYKCKKLHQNHVHTTTFMKTEVIRRRISISIITVVYAHVSLGAARYSVLPGLQPRLHTAASAETAEAAVTFTVNATVAAVSVATTADVSFAAAAVCRPSSKPGKCIHHSQIVFVFVMDKKKLRLKP